MKELVVKKMRYVDPSGKKGNIFIDEEFGITVHDVILELGIGEEITVGHISDIHYNYCNQEDFEENDPVLMSTFKYREWLANGETVELGRKCFSALEGCDQIVLNGDTLDFLSKGTLELMDKEVWEKYPEVIATVGGHEFCRKMQGEVPETLSYTQRQQMVIDRWKHDIFYYSKLIKNKVLVVGVCNDLAYINDYQVQCFKKDIALAKEKDYKIILFMHEPIRTNNPDDAVVRKEDILIPDSDTSGFPLNLETAQWKKGEVLKFYLGADCCKEKAKEFYSMIVNNADYSKAVFTAHQHCELYFEIKAKTSEGKDAIIPQYVKTASAYCDGMVMRIFIR